MPSQSSQGPYSADPADPQSTHLLLVAWGAGDPDAGQELVERYRPALHSSAALNPWMRAIENHTSVEDVVQEVFWRAFSSNLFEAREGRESGALWRALQVVLERVLVDNHRRLAAAKRGAGVSVFSLDGEEREASGPLLAEMSSPMTTPTEGARSAELLRLCREQLEDREWTVWRLRVVAGLGFDEIASLTESTAASVRGVMHRARKKLILALADLDPDAFPG